MHEEKEDVSSFYCCSKRVSYVARLRQVDHSDYLRSSSPLQYKGSRNNDMPFVSADSRRQHRERFRNLSDTYNMRHKEDFTQNGLLCYRYLFDIRLYVVIGIVVHGRYSERLVLI